MLLAHGADLDMKDDEGKTPVEMAEGRRNPELAAFLKKAAEDTQNKK